MEYAIDIALIAVFTLTVIVGVKRGFAKSVLGIVGTVASFILAYLFSKPLAELLYTNIADGLIKEKLAEKFSGELSGAVDLYTEITRIVSSIPDGLVNLASKVGVNISGLTEQLLSLEVTNDTVLNALADTVIKPVALVIMSLLCCVLIFAVSSIVFSIIAKLIDKVFKLPVLGAANKILGAVFGVVKGVIAVIFICTVIDVLYGFIGNGNFALAVESSKILSFFNSHNVIAGYLNK